ncbi:precorrin-6A reductase [Methanobrevibacter woesei]|uniref:precorrin-6A reductase n=1 Tax=Methanobrevibacter woesei TaxID=190976 RepID=UPI0026E02740|nr:precorrin-6A reductase [Methanobrevibacter woesei]
MKKLNVFLMGGTKESIEIIKFIKNNFNSYILTTTTTEYGSKLAIDGGSDATIAKPLPKDEIINILNGKTNFDIFIDATHPFASHVTNTAIEVSKICKIPYIRFERPTSNFENIDDSRVIQVNSFDDAGKLIAEKYNQSNVLHFAGANTMETILKYVSPEYFYPRILEVKSSLEKCEELGIKKDHIIPMKGTSTIEENEKLIEKTDASIIITKESGDIGGVIPKIKAANSKNIDVLLITRPVIESLNKKDVVNSIEELNERLINLIN